MNRALLSSLLLTGCVIGGDRYPRPRDLAPAWLVDRPRVLGIRASPPEVRPGETVTFEALVPTPGATAPYTVIWLACPPADDGGIGFGCPIPETLDLTDVNALAALGVIGVEPFLPPVYTVPDDALDGLAPADRAEGLYTLIQVTALPPDLLDPATAPDTLDFNEIEAAYKRLVVSEAATPNQNPEIVAFTADGIVVPPGAPLHVTAGQDYDLSVQLSPTAIETYTFVTSEGTPEDREEEPYLSWYATAGEVEEPVTLFPYPEATWTAPATVGETGTVWAVLRDRRGGMAWWAQEIVVEAP